MASSPSLASATFCTPISFSERMMFFRALAELSATNALIFMSNLVPRVTDAAFD
jgi:hypothetical protein